jgi:hypothetical protein
MRLSELAAFALCIQSGGTQLLVSGASGAVARGAGIGTPRLGIKPCLEMLAPRAFGFPHVDLSQLLVLICTSNSTGGVMDKRIDPQNIVLATAAIDQLGQDQTS